MPRDGSQIYAIPVGTEGIADHTIESARYNTFCADVEQDLNLPRPIIAGGTGASSSTAAMIALGGEIANQVVTNYDLFAFKSGSFSSAKGATAAPTADADYVGAAVVTGPDSIVLEARALGTAAAGVRYVREKKKVLPTDANAVWDATWTVITSPNDKVNKSGDTMTGNLTITNTQAVLTINKTLANDHNLIYGSVNGVAQWRLDLGDGSGNLAIHRWLDGGTYAGSPFSIGRVSGDATFSNNVGIVGAVTINGTLTATGAANVSGTLGVGGALSCGNLSCGAVTSGGAGRFNDYVMAGAASADTGIVYWTGGGTRHIQYIAGQFRLTGGPFMTQGNAIDTGGGAISCGPFSMSGNLTVGGSATVGGDLGVSGSTIGLRGVNTLQNLGDAYTSIRSGQDQSHALRLGGSATGWVNDYNAETHNFRMIGNNNALMARIMSIGTFEVFSRFDIAGDGFKPGGGLWNDNSDARIKTVLGDYTAGLDEIISLTPRRFTFKGNDTRQPIEEGATAPYQNSLHYQPAASGKEFIGLVAQEAELVMPELVKKVSGYIDGTQVNDVRELDTTALIFALVNAVRQLTARIEDLEATR